MENKKIVSTYGSIIVITVIALFFIKHFNISYPLRVITSTTQNELSVVGEGKVEAVPDTATVEVGITVNNALTAKAAQKSISEVNNKVLKAMQKLGISKKNIKTTNFSVYPEYNYETNTRDIIGYSGSASLSIKVKDIELASKVVDSATSAGANEVRGTTFSIDKPEDYREQARNKAIKNAKEQAEKLAQNLGINLGKITNIVEQSTSDRSYPMAFEAKGLGGEQDSPSFEPGTQTISSVVTLYFEKK